MSTDKNNTTGLKDVVIKPKMTSALALKTYGNPNDPKVQSACMQLWVVPNYILTSFSHVRFSALGTIGFPKKIFCNKDFKPKLEASLNELIVRNLAKEMKTWDGCFIIRQKRGLSSLSMHSWGLAVDINAFENQLNQQPKLSKEFVKCFTDNGLTWGGTWGRKDGMHFEF